MPDPDDQSVRTLCQSCKRDPNGNSFSNLAADGVYRVYNATTFEVIEADRLNPRQIKEYLDRRGWKQEIEDEYSFRYISLNCSPVGLSVLMPLGG